MSIASKNSFRFAFSASSTEVFSGADCGTTASITKTLPSGATGIKVSEPAVGDRDEAGGTRVTADRIEYLRLAGYIGKIEWFGGIITCSP